MATIEDIYAALIKEGVRRELHVVPEFCVTPKTRLFEKKIDVAWLRQRDDSVRVGSLRRWKIVAAFEIEGYDVSLDRLRMHSEQFQHLWADEDNFPCFVPLYTQAFHRVNPDWGNRNLAAKIQQHVNKACSLGSVIQVKDGRNLDWVLNIPDGT